MILLDSRGMLPLFNHIANIKNMFLLFDLIFIWYVSKLGYYLKKGLLQNIARIYIPIF